MDTTKDREFARGLKAAGMLDADIALKLGVSIWTIRRWRYQERLASEPPAPLVARSCPICRGTDVNPPAYSYLLGLYLGDGHVARQSNGVYRLEIACCNAYPGLIDAAARAVGTVMPSSRVGRRQQTGCTMVGSYSKHWPCLLPQHGPGRKHERKIELVGWQREIVDEFTEELVRGLIHSDGWRGTNRVRRPVAGQDKWYEYPRYNFTNESMDIQGIFTDALDRLGIAWKQMNRKNVSVAKREAVARLDEFVGPKY